MPAVEKVPLAALAGIMASGMPNPDLQREIGGDPNFPYQKGEDAYNYGTLMPGASLGAGAAGAFAGREPVEWVPFTMAPVLAGMANPKNNPFVKIAEYLDNDK